MVDQIGRQVKFIAKLLRLSQEGRIEWKAAENGGFTGKVINRDVRVFEQERRLNMLANTRIIVLEILLDNGRVGYTIENVVGLKDLMASASSRAAGIDDFIDDVLAS